MFRYWKADLIDPNTPVLVDKTEHDEYEWATKERAHELLLAEVIRKIGPRECPKFCDANGRKLRGYESISDKSRVKI